MDWCYKCLIQSCYIALAFSLDLGIRTKLLHHSAVLSMPSGVMMSCFCSLSSQSLNSFCSAYAMCLWGALYGLLFGFSCKENVPAKHPIPLKISSKSKCSCFVISVLALLSLS